jgi:hypothetical protein
MEKEKKIDKLVADLADKSSSSFMTEDGKVEDADNFRNFQELLEIFKPIFKKDDKDCWKRLNEAKCSLVNPETEAYPGQNWVNIFEWIKENQRVSYSELQKETSLIIRKKQETLKLQKFTLIFPINVGFAKRIKSKFGKDDLEIIPYEAFRSEFFDVDAEIKKASSNQNLGVLDLLTRQKHVCNENFSYFAITTKAREYSFAVGYVSEKMFTILALLIFAKRRHQRPSHESLLPIKISTLARSYVFIFKGKKYINSSYPRGETISEQEFIAKKFFPLSSFFPEEFDAATFDFFRQLLDRYNKIARSDIGETLDKALKSYYEASVANRLDHSVFYYWLTIESLLKVRPMKYEEMRRILKKVVKGHEYSDLIVDRLMQIRHGFAHEGTMEVESPIRNLAKVFCDALIDWFLLKFGKQFSSKAELGKIYAFIQEDSESLRTDMRIIDTILRAISDTTDT